MEEERFNEIPKKKKKKKKGRWVRPVLIVICVFLSLILIAISAAWIYLNHLLDQVEYVQGTEATLSSDEAADVQTEGLETIDPNEDLPDIGELVVPGDSDPGEIQADSPQGDITNILLIGQDRRPGEGRCRSDSMILVTFNKTTGVITMTSFMRDSYVKIPGYSDYKINHAYQYGGMSLLNETLYVNYGVEVHGNVAVDFSQFEDLIDLLGGVDIYLEEREASYLNRHHEGWDLVKGMNHLNGEKALAYSRIRYIDNDYYRAERQRNVIQSLIDTYKSLPLLDMLGKLDDVLGLVSTNMEKKQIISLATELFPMLSTAEYGSQQIPAEGTFKGGNVQVRPGLKDWFQYNIDFDTNREILREIFDSD